MKTFLLIYLVFAIAGFLVTVKDFGCFAVTPKEIYEINNMNMFACVLLSILWFIINPLYDVARFIHWIFHVGRKN